MAPAPTALILHVNPRQANGTQHEPTTNPEVTIDQIELVITTLGVFLALLTFIVALVHLRHDGWSVGFRILWLGTELAHQRRGSNPVIDPEHPSPDHLPSPRALNVGGIELQNRAQQGREQHAPASPPVADPFSDDTAEDHQTEASDVADGSALPNAAGTEDMRFAEHLGSESGSR